jgi:hypothetical protein
MRISGRMKFVQTAVCVALVAIAGAGCAGSRNTNLTPRSLPVATDSSYLFETTFTSDRRGVYPESVKAWVMIDLQLYPMQRVPNTENRFEALIPLPRDRNVVRYNYKFEYAYAGTAVRLYDSKLSPEYTLVIPK